MKPILKRTAFKIAKSQILQITPVPIPVIQIMDYIASNHKFVQKKKYCLMAHPRKIIKCLPGIAISDIINSDLVNGTIDHIVDGRMHDAASMGVQALKFALVLI